MEEYNLDDVFTSLVLIGERYGRILEKISKEQSLIIQSYEDRIRKQGNEILRIQDALDSVNKRLREAGNNQVEVGKHD